MALPMKPMIAGKSALVKLEKSGVLSDYEALLKVMNAHRTPKNVREESITEMDARFEPEWERIQDNYRNLLTEIFGSWKSVAEDYCDYLPYQRTILGNPPHEAILRDWFNTRLQWYRKSVERRLWKFTQLKRDLASTCETLGPFNPKKHITRIEVSAKKGKGAADKLSKYAGGYNPRQPLLQGKDSEHGVYYNKTDVNRLLRDR